MIIMTNAEARNLFKYMRGNLGAFVGIYRRKSEDFHSLARFVGSVFSDYSIHLFIYPFLILEVWKQKLLICS